MSENTPADAADTPADTPSVSTHRRARRGGGSPGKRGADPLPPPLVRDVCVSVRLDKREAAVLDAKRGRLQRGEWMRCALLDAWPPAGVPEINRQAWAELARVGANLNQLAHHLNGGASVELPEVRRLVDELRAQLIGAKRR